LRLKSGLKRLPAIKKVPHLIKSLKPLIDLCLLM
jgi:hypothetical protein